MKRYTIPIDRNGIHGLTEDPQGGLCYAEDALAVERENARLRELLGGRLPTTFPRWDGCLTAEAAEVIKAGFRTGDAVSLVHTDVLLRLLAGKGEVPEEAVSPNAPPPR